MSIDKRIERLEDAARAEPEGLSRDTLRAILRLAASDDQGVELSRIGRNAEAHARFERQVIKRFGEETLRQLYQIWNRSDGTVT